MADSEQEPKRTKSGNHPAVVAYRERLKEIGAEGNKALDDLDKTLTEFLADETVPSTPARRAAGGRR